jgi:hypothetical protein
LFDPNMPDGITWTMRERLNRIKFDSKAWREFRRGTDANEWPHTTLLPVRLRMVDDLLKNHPRRGMTREEVTSLLGLKTETEYFREWDLVYYLGPGRYGTRSVIQSGLSFDLIRAAG